jgi:hypothetical protein
MRIGTGVLAAITVMLAGMAHAAPTPDALKATAADLRDRALGGGSSAYAVVESLTTEVGPRLAGTPAAQRATDWAVAKLKALGFQNVHTEAFPITAWVRGVETAEVTSPYPQKLILTALGGSVATPPEGIEAEIALFPTYAALLAAPAGSLTGKIAVVTQPMGRREDGTAYGYNNPTRRSGASEAARRGAVAYLLRSLSTDDTRLPHAGAMNYQDGAPKIPAAALSTPDAELLDHMVARGKPVRVKLTLRPTEAPATAWNVFGDIPGSEKPDEVVLIGGHLDSWDLGTGAVDDGAGVGIVTGAAKLIMNLPRPPRRTVRVVYWGAEEMDYAGPAFAGAHQAEAGHYVIASEADFGSGPVLQINVPPGAADSPYARTLAELFAPQRVVLSRDPALRAGDDLARLKGVPFFALRQDGTRYFDLHHSADDTLDKIDRSELDRATAVWAAAVYLAADSDIDFRAMSAPSTSAPR